MSSRELSKAIVHGTLCSMGSIISLNEQKKGPSMADSQIVSILEKGAFAWNKWRQSTRQTPDLSGVDLSYADLRPYNLSGVNFAGGNLRNANLGGANMSASLLAFIDLENANLQGVNLTYANIDNARLSGCYLRRASLRSANLAGAYLRKADFSFSDLTVANLRESNLVETHAVGACLREATLVSADLREANFSDSDLRRADLRGADLSFASLVNASMDEAILDEADLRSSNFSYANLTRASLRASWLERTIFGATKLKEATGLSSINIRRACVLDPITLELSGALPRSFLRGCGWPDSWLEDSDSRTLQPRKYFSCFISYNSADRDFAGFLYEQLTARGIRCWFDKNDMMPGARISDGIATAIRDLDRVLLCCSKASLGSSWVKEEIRTARDREREEAIDIIIPIMLDNYFLDSWEDGLASDIRSRAAADFSGWREHGDLSDELRKLIMALEVV